jgi:hypothetical protein
LPADVPSVVWALGRTVVSPPPAADLRGQQVQGRPGKRFVYLSWGVVDDTGAFHMFRRAELWLDAVPDAVMARAWEDAVLVGQLGLTDDNGWPRCAPVRPPESSGRRPRPEPGTSRW